MLVFICAVGLQLFPRFLGAPLQHADRATWGAIVVSLALLVRLATQPMGGEPLREASLAVAGVGLPLGAILALGILEGARGAGLRVPDDLAVVGYNDIEVAAYLGLTTVHVPMRELGQRGLQLLLRAIELPESRPEHIRLPAELVVRGTSGG